MINRETGLTRMPSPMGNAQNKEYVNALYNKVTALPTRSEELADRLINTYNNKAYANRYAPLLSNYSNLYMDNNGQGHQDDTVVATLRNGERLGFVDRNASDNGTRYGIGLDNIGDPYRGVYDGELNTPYGKLDYGYDGDTVGAGFTPNAQTMAYLQALQALLNR